jgi:predicted enzyme related to lactoylglutathione lyase
VEGPEAVTVHIRDVERTRAFHSEVPGPTEGRFLPAGSRVAFAIPGTTTRRTMHVQLEGDGGREPGPVSGIVFSHHDPVAACAEIRRRGGTVVDEPRTFTAALGTVTLGVFADPDGNQFVLRHVRR